MAIDKALNQAPTGLQEDIESMEPDLEIEIEDPESVTIKAGGMEIELDVPDPGVLPDADPADPPPAPARLATPEPPAYPSTGEYEPALPVPPDCPVVVVAPPPPPEPPFFPTADPVPPPPPPDAAVVDRFDGLPVLPVVVPTTVPPAPTVTLKDEASVCPVKYL